MNPESTPPAAPPADRSARSAMMIAFLVVAIDLLGFGIVLPLIPRITDDFLKAYDETSKGILIGLLYSLFSLMQFIFSPMWGRISDRIGRRPILLLSLAGSVVFYGMFGFAASLPAEQATLAVALLMISRIGAGIAGASVSTAAAVIADCTTPEKRAHGMALIGAAFGIGFTFGPLIAWAGEEVFQGAKWGPGAAASLLSLVALALAFGVFRETLRPGPKPPREYFSLHRTREVLRMPTVGPLVLIYFLVIFSFANFEATISLFTKSAFGLNERDNYLVFAYIGFVLMMAQGGLYRPLAKRWSERPLLNTGVFMMLAGLAGLTAVAVGAHRLQPSLDAVSGLKPLFYLSMTVAVTGFAFVNPSISSLVSRRADPTRQGEVLGVNQSFAALGRILGPFAGSFAFYQDPTRMMPYLIASGVLLLVLFLLPLVRAPKAS